jgi:ATP-dependent DNA helicase RecG
MDEGTTFDKKSLLCFPDDPKRWDWQKLAKHCIAFANARGGKLHFGIEDKADAPPASQRIDPSLPDRLRKGIGSHCINVAVSSAIITVPNGGEVLELTIFPSRQTVASDTGGRFYMRVADESKPVMPEDLPRLLAEKDAYVWEAQTTRKISISQADPLKLARFIADIRASDRVSAFIRDQSDAEILDHFVMSRDGRIDQSRYPLGWPARRPGVAAARARHSIHQI